MVSMLPLDRQLRHRQIMTVNENLLLIGPAGLLLLLFGGVSAERGLQIPICGQEFHFPIKLQSIQSVNLIWYKIEFVLLRMKLMQVFLMGHRFAAVFKRGNDGCVVLQVRV